MNQHLRSGCACLRLVAAAGGEEEGHAQDGGDGAGGDGDEPLQGGGEDGVVGGVRPGMHWGCPAGNCHLAGLGT